VPRDRARDRMSGQPERSASHVSIDQRWRVFRDMMRSPEWEGFISANMSGQHEVGVNCVKRQAPLHPDSARASSA